MQINFPDKSVKDLALLVCLGDWVRGAIADLQGEDFDYWHEEITEEFFKSLKEQGFKTLTQEFGGSTLPSDELDKECEDLIDDYDDDVFWHELKTRFGKRDFQRTITPEEVIQIAKNDWLPERVHTFYKKYEEEFFEHGIDRLEIVEK